MHADLNPVSFACSQLQNYDPERALTDYINRLEALQRRLGSVQSGKGSGRPPHDSWVPQGTVPSQKVCAGSLRYITNISDFRHFQP